MNAKKYIANNARAALQKVKEDLGSDAVILSNRAIPGGVEILAVAQKEFDNATPSFSMPEPKKTAQATKKTSAFTPSIPSTRISVTDEDDSDYSAMLTSARRNNFQNAKNNFQKAHNKESKANKPLGQAITPSMTQILQATAARLTQQMQSQNTKKANTTAAETQTAPNAQKSTVNGKKISKTESANNSANANVAPNAVPNFQNIPSRADHNALMREIQDLRKLVSQQLAGFAWGLNQNTAPMKNEMLAWMLNSGFSPQFSRDLLKEMPTTSDRTEASNWVQRATDRALSIADSESDIIAQGGIFALVGPTGVGKTTTAAKLAARAVLQHGADKVALITTDNYRVGAHEQLRIYGRILGVVVFLAKDSRDLQQTLMELRSKHLVLIDTMGMSQRDKMVAELTSMLSNNFVQRIMLLNATSQGDTLDDVVHAYMGNGVAGCILTKTDEAASVASALDVIMRHKMRLHYISNGQRVPQDLHLPNRGYLMHRAFKSIPNDSAHHLEGIEPAYRMGAC